MRARDTLKRDTLKKRTAQSGVCVCVCVCVCVYAYLPMIYIHIYLHGPISGETRHAETAETLHEIGLQRSRSEGCTMPSGLCAQERGRALHYNPTF